MFIWTIGDVIQVALLAFLALGFGFFALHRLVVQWLCRHDGRVIETSACDAVCGKCGKNLGFIGTWRDSHPR